MKHRDATKTRQAARQLATMLYDKLGKRVQGPIDPQVIRIRNQYQQYIYIRFEKQAKVIHQIKSLIDKAVKSIKKDETIRQVQIAIDVDPY